MWFRKKNENRLTLKKRIYLKLWDIKSSIDHFGDGFQRETYYGYAEPPAFQFSSPITIGIRWVLKHRYVALVLTVATWLLLVFLSVTANAAESVFTIVVNAALGPALVLAALFLAVLMVLMVLTAVEAIAKQIASLILYGELSTEIENPSDQLVCHALNARPGDKRK